MDIVLRRNLRRVSLPTKRDSILLLNYHSSVHLLYRNGGELFLLNRKEKIPVSCNPRNVRQIDDSIENFFHNLFQNFSRR